LTKATRFFDLKTSNFCNVERKAHIRNQTDKLKISFLLKWNKNCCDRKARATCAQSFKKVWTNQRNPR